MQKIVVDTNVLVSAFIQKSYPYFIVNEFFISRKVELCISEELFKEYYLVLNRKKFAKYLDFKSKAEALLVDIETKASKYSPKRKLYIISDIDDNKILELAEECKADFIITGNTNDFTMKKYKYTKIVSPKEYWENWFPKED